MSVRVRLSALAGLAICALLSPSVRADTLPTLRVATLPNDSGAQVFYAADMGFLKKVGLNIKVTMLNSGSIISSGVASGSFDIGQSALSSLASAHERGVPFVIIAPSGLWSSDHVTSALVVPKDSPIRSARDLAGKTIAVNALMTVTQFGPQAWIEKNGGDPSSVKFVEMPFPQMPTAVAAQRVDAAEMTEPFLAEARANGERVLSAPYDAIAKEFVLGAWFSTSQFAKTHPADVSKFHEAMMEAGRWANTHHAESARILEKYTKTHVPSAMPRVAFPTRSDPAQAQALIDVSARYHGLKTAFPAADLYLPASKGG